MNAPPKHLIGLCLLLFMVAGTAWWLSMTMYMGDIPDDKTSAVTTLRSYRLIIGMITGANLAIAGVIMQGLFRNPLADPGIIGAGAGATLGGLIALLFWHSLSPFLAPWIGAEMLVPIFSMFGAIGSLALILLLLRTQSSTTTVLLFGVALSMLFSGAGMLIRHLVQDDWQLNRALMALSLGHIGDKGWEHMCLTLPMLIGSLIAGMMWAPQLDLLQTGEDESRSLGLDLSRTRWWLIIWAAVPVAAAVAVAGNIGFVGLMVPHMIRRLIGPQHQLLIPFAAIAGAVFVLIADVIGHAPGPGQYIPLGVISSLIGAPLFIWLLIKQQRRQWT